MGLLSRCNEELRLFLLEIFLSVAAPFSLLLVRRIRDSAQGLYLAAVLTLLGFAIFGLVARYLPIFPQREGAYARRFALFTDASSSRAVGQAQKAAHLVLNQPPSTSGPKSDMHLICDERSQQL